MNESRQRRLISGLWPQEGAFRPKLLSPFSLALIAAIIAAFVMPQQSPFPYRFEYGQPWNYNALKAPFDFEVLYPEEQVQDKIEQIKSEHAPYYILATDVARRQKKLLRSFMQERTQVSGNDARYEELLKNPTRYEAYGQQLLSKLFERGIAGPKLEALQQEDPAAGIYVIRKNVEKPVEASAIPTLADARGFLIDTLPYSTLRQPELLLPILEKALAPNVFYSDSLTTTIRRKKIAAVASTGITVRKGETIVRKGAFITDEIYRKLDSLYRRYETPKGLHVIAGYALLAFIGFLLYFFWLRQTHPSIWEKREALFFGPIVVLSSLLLIQVSSWIGPALVFMVPIWGIPLFLNRSLGPPLGIIIAALLMALSVVSLDWSAGWLAIQMTGASTLLFLAPQGSKWVRLLQAVVLTTILQALVWWACYLAGKIPASLPITDSLLFLAFGNGLLLLILPLGTRIKKWLNLGEPV